MSIAAHPARLRRGSLARLGAALVALAPLAPAATVNWTAPSSANLAGASNWSGSAVPTAADEAVFTSVPTTALVSGNTLSWGNLVWNTNTTASIEIGSGASANRLFTLGGGAGYSAAIAAGGASGDLILLGDNVTGGTLTISGQTNGGGFALRPTLGADGKFNVKNAGATLAISATLQGDFALTKTGAGALTLSGTNLFGASKTFTIAAGTVNADANRALGSGNVALAGGTLVVRSSGAGAVALQDGKSFTMSGGVLQFTLGSSVSYDQIVGVGSGAFSITGGVLDLGDSVGDYSVSYTLFNGFASGSVSGLSIINYDTANYTAILGNNGVLSFSPSPIPEPSASAALVGGLGLGLAALRRRRRS